MSSRLIGGGDTLRLGGDTLRLGGDRAGVTDRLRFGLGEGDLSREGERV